MNEQHAGLNQNRSFMRWKLFVVASLIHFGTCLTSPGQSGLHRLAGITAMPDRTISLELDGSASPLLRS